MSWYSYIYDYEYEIRDLLTPTPRKTRRCDVMINASRPTATLNWRHYWKTYIGCECQTHPIQAVGYVLTYRSLDAVNWSAPRAASCQSWMKANTEVFINLTTDRAVHALLYVLCTKTTGRGSSSLTHSHSRDLSHCCYGVGHIPITRQLVGGD